MEGLILPSISRPPPIISLKQDTHSDASLKFIKSKIYLNRTLEAPYAERERRVLDAYIDSLAKRGRLREAIAALDSVASRGSKVTPKTFIHLIESCIESNSLEFGHQLYKRVGLISEDDPFVETKLVSMFAKCGHLGKARKVFDEMRERNLYTWSALIGAFSRARKWSEVVDLFFLMMEDGFLPDEFLFQKILPACANCGNFDVGKLIHSIVLRCGMHHDIRLNNSILAVYAKCGDICSVRRFFDNMDEKDLVSWNCLITAYCQNGDVEEARQLMDSMHANCIEPGPVTWNILITNLNRFGNCDQAMELVKEMESFGIIPDVFTWTSMISGLSQNNKESQALDLFGEVFSSGIEPNEITLMTIISASASVKSLRKGKQLHSISVKSGFAEDVLVGNALIDMYSKCGKLDYARNIFDSIMDKDTYTWNSMIGGYCQGGYCGKAHDLFINMQESDTELNVVTWNTMITCYLEIGEEDKALDIFSRMGKHDTASWNALIAGYLQIGHKDKALRMFRQMQSLNVKPNSVTILSALPACATLLAVDKVKEIHSCVLRRNLGTDLSVLNSLIDTYAKAGKIGYSRTIFEFSTTSKDFITWNAMITGYIQHGYPNGALEVYEQMEKSGLKPNRGTFVGLIAACGLAGYVEEGKRAFFSMNRDYNILPCSEHYVAMIDLFGRSGNLEEAVNFVEERGVKPDFSIWSALLTASRINGNTKFAIIAAEKLLELEPENHWVRQCVSQAHSLNDITLDNSLVLRKPNRLNENKRIHGLSWVEVRNVVHMFTAGDQSRPNSNILHSWVKSRVSETSVSNYSGVRIEEEENEVSCGIHSEKLAIAFAMNACRGNKKVIRIVKNTRMCGECHGFVKSVSRLYGFEIFLKDNKCLHHFNGGSCSCGDYW